jgi:molybdopterin converting factor small subunit
MPVLKILGGLRRFAAGRERRVEGATVAAVLRASTLPESILFPDGRFNRDAEVLVNGRNIAFLDGLETPLAEDDSVTIFLHGARGYPGG